MIFPGLYAMLFALLGVEWTAMVAAGHGWRVAAILLPLTAGAGDYVENILLLWIVGAWPHRIDGIVRSASRATQAKLTCFSATLALPLLHRAAAAIG
jgi:hypothetical protein